MVILGVDPGLCVTGFGIIAIDGGVCRMLSCGVVRSRSNKKATVAERLYELHVGLATLITEFTPREMAIEKIFFHQNNQSALSLGQARGVLLCAAVAQGCAVFEYTALQVKLSVVGYGHAAKDQVRHMVARLLSLPGLPQTDAADALACALCHAYRSALSI